MKVWITRYALSKGLFELEVESPSAAHVRGMGDQRYHWYSKPDWHETEAEAKERAEEMRIKKAASLSGQLLKIRRLRF